MSKGAYISRYLMIIDKIRRYKYCTMQEILDTIESKMELLQDNDTKAGVSKRTVERDIQEIRNLFKISIEYSHSERGYYISNEDNNDIDVLSLLDSYEILNVIKNTEGAMPYVFLENKKANGSGIFDILLKAIQQSKCIRFTYTKFDDDSSTDRLVVPLALKEFKYRWYLIAQDTETEVLKTFGIDRITSPSIYNKKVKIQNKIDIQSMFKDSFGIIYNEGNPETVRIAFDEQQAKYIKSLPLHSSQKEESTVDGETIFSYKIHITFDFIQEILSLGNQARVLSPAKLIKSIKASLKSSLEMYG